MAAQHQRTQRVDGQHPRRGGNVGDGGHQVRVDGAADVAGGVVGELVDEGVDGGAGLGEAVGQVAEDVVLSGFPQGFQHVGHRSADGVVLGVADQRGDVLVAGQQQAVHGAEVVPDQPDGHARPRRDGARRGFLTRRDERDGGVTESCSGCQIISHDTSV